MLYNKQGVGKNRQTHGSYVFFPVKTKGVIRSPVTHITKQIV